MKSRRKLWSTEKSKALYAKVQKNRHESDPKIGASIWFRRRQTGPRFMCAFLLFHNHSGSVCSECGLIAPASGGFDDITAPLPEQNPVAAIDPDYLFLNPFKLTSSAHLKQSVFGFAGRTNSGNLGSTFAVGIGNPGTIVFDNYIVGGAYQRDFIQFNSGILIGAEVGIADRFGTYRICCDTVVRSDRSRTFSRTLGRGIFSSRRPRVVRYAANFAWCCVRIERHIKSNRTGRLKSNCPSGLCQGALLPGL